MKKWLSVLLAAVMLLAMAGVAGAAVPQEAEGTIAFTGLEDGEKVVAYQIIEYTYNKDGQYTNADWVAAIKANKKYENVKVDDVKNTLPAEMSESQFYEAVRKLVENNTSYQSDKNNEITGLKAGSYLCLISGGTTVHQLHIVSLNPIQKEDGEWTLRVNEGNQPNATEKASRPVLDKTMKVEEKGTKQDYDTVAIGNEVTFDIYATVPKYPDDASNHTYSIDDTMSSVLTLNEESIKVSLISDSSVLLEKGVDYTITRHQGDEGFKVNFTYNSIKGEATDKVAAWNNEAGRGYEGRVDTTQDASRLSQGVHIQYKATVNNTIELGSDDNKNHAKLEYSDNPYGESTSEINDEVKVYTYGLKIDKVDGKTHEPLAGAKFEINVKGDASKKLSFVNGTVQGEYIVAKEGATGATQELVTLGSGKITIKGLDVGEYELRETVAPGAPGQYNKLTQPVGFVITPLPGENGTFVMKYVKDGYETIGGEKKPSAYLPETIENFSGIQIPSTGGMGTTIFMVAGIAVMACAVVALMLVLKRQKHSEG